MIEEFSSGQENEISNLIKTVFDEFVGFEYSAEGNGVFYDFIRPESIRERYEKGNLILTCRKDGKIVGMIEVRDNNHVCLFFVDRKYHKLGIGKRLFDEILEKVKGKTDFLEVNASTFSETVYSRLGFKKIGDVTEKSGITYIPMKMEL